jgi:D-tyrosyl-tRNA(Tyr) deacylase
VQRVIRARVLVDGRVVGEIGKGLLVFLGVGRQDDAMGAGYLADKIANLRIFEDSEGKMNRSLLDLVADDPEARVAALVVSQFTLYGDVRKGRRPGFDSAAPPEDAHHLYQEFISALRLCGVHVQTGVFQADMAVELVNDGPVTLLLDSEKTF